MALRGSEGFSGALLIQLTAASHQAASGPTTGWNNHLFVCHSVLLLELLHQTRRK